MMREQPVRRTEQPSWQHWAMSATPRCCQSSTWRVATSSMLCATQPCTCEWCCGRASFWGAGGVTLGLLAQPSAGSSFMHMGDTHLVFVRWQSTTCEALTVCWTTLLPYSPLLPSPSCDPSPAHCSWKTIVVNTPRTLQDILPALMAEVITALADPGGLRMALAHLSAAHWQPSASSVCFEEPILNLLTTGGSFCYSVSTFTLASVSVP